MIKESKIFHTKLNFEFEIFYNMRFKLCFFCIKDYFLDKEDLRIYSSFNLEILVHNQSIQTQ